jgi:hypothetical protein
MANGTNTTNTGFPGYKEKEISPFSDPFTGESFVLPTSSYNTDAKINYEKQKAIRARTQGLIELDPHTAESLLLNIGGAWEEAQERKQFDDIRKTAIKDEMAKAKAKQRKESLNSWEKQLEDSYSDDPGLQRYIQGQLGGYRKIMSRFDGDASAARAWIEGDERTKSYIKNRERDVSVANDLQEMVSGLDGEIEILAGRMADMRREKINIPKDMESKLKDLRNKHKHYLKLLSPNLAKDLNENQQEKSRKKLVNDLKKLTIDENGNENKDGKKWFEGGWESLKNHISTTIDNARSYWTQSNTSANTEQRGSDYGFLGKDATATTATEDDRLTEGTDFQPMSDEAFKRMTGVDGQQSPVQPSTAPIPKSPHPDVTKSMLTKLSKVKQTVQPTVQPTGQPTDNVNKFAPLTTNVVGENKDGRSVILNKDGTHSSERSRTFKVGDKWYNYPSMFDGVEETDENKLRKIFIANNGVDPETGIKAKGYNTVEEALAVAEGRSPTLGVVDNPPKNIVDNMEGKGDRPPTRNIKDLINGFKNLLDFGEEKRIDGNVINNKIYEEGENLPPEEKTKWFEAWGQAADDYMNVTNNPLGPGQVLGRGGNFITGKLIEGVGWASDIARSLVSGDSNDNVDNRDPLQSRLEAEEFQQRRRDERNRDTVEPDDTTLVPTKRINIPVGGDKKSGKEVIESINHGLSQSKNKISGMKNQYYNSLAEVESSMGKNTEHKSSAVGLFALMPKWMLDTPYAQTMGYKNTPEDLAQFAKDLEDPSINARVAAEHTYINKQRLDKNIITGNWASISSSPNARKEWEDLLAATHFLGITRMNKILGTLEHTTGGVSMQTIMTSFKKAPSRITAFEKQLGKTKSASGKKAIKKQIEKLRHDGDAYQHVKKFRISRTKKRD